MQEKAPFTTLFRNFSGGILTHQATSLHADLPLFSPKRMACMRKAYTTYGNHTSRQHQFKTAFQKAVSFHPHYLTFTPQIYHCSQEIYTTIPTTCTLFTPDPAEYTSNLDLQIHNRALPMATHPKVLGLTLDPKLTYRTHIHNISVHAYGYLQL